MYRDAVRMKLPWITVFLSVSVDCYFRRCVLICRVSYLSRNPCCVSGSSFCVSLKRLLKLTKIVILLSQLKKKVHVILACPPSTIVIQKFCFVTDLVNCPVLLRASCRFLLIYRVICLGFV